MVLNSYRLTKCGMLLGNLFEHYDTALFSLLSPFLAPLFFPKHDAITALILTYAIIPLSMIARPIGALFFGYLGDFKSRKKALTVSLFGMAFVTTCMGLIPTYEQVGIFAPILLSIFRLLQNFFASGENVGGAIYLMEQENDDQHDLISGLFNASTIAGILLASLGVSCLYLTDTIHLYWRTLYFLGFLTAVFAYFLRSQADTFYLNSAIPLNQLLKNYWKYRKVIFTIAVTAGFSYASYTIAFVMINGLAPLVSSVNQQEMMHLTTLLLVFDFLLLPIFGLLAKYFSREKMMITAGLLAASSGLFLFNLLHQANFIAVIAVRFILLLIGVLFSAPFYSWAQQIAPSAYRFTTISFGYAIGSQIFGGPSAAISLWLFHQTGSVTSAAWYWMCLGLLASYVVFRQYKSQEETLVYQKIPKDY